jgi:D-methionine transport system substrate-binding protein
MKRSLQSALLLGALALAGAVLLHRRAAPRRPTLTVGAVPVPHAELLEQVKARLQKEGIELRIVVYDNEDLLNPALAEHTLDANFFQHVPYLQAVAREKGYDFVLAGAVHVEPIGFYATRARSREELRDGAVIGLPNNPSNEFRALALLQAQGLIRLRPGLEGFSATPRDIAENPRHFTFVEADVAQLPRSLPDLDGAVINTNIAIDARISPASALFREGVDSPYANGIVVRRGEEGRPEIRRLVAALQSPEVKEFLAAHYGGSIVPAFR